MPRSRGARSLFFTFGALIACAATSVLAMSCAGPLGGAASGTTSGSTGSGAGGAGRGSGHGGGTPDAGQPDGILLDASGYCGNQVHQVNTDPPNLYFVFDVSDSMNDMVSGGFTKYQLVQQSAVQMIESLGPLINFGAALFPEGQAPNDPCAQGTQVLSVVPGDPVGAATGPNTGAFIQATSVTPAGGTPTAATLTGLQPDLVKLKGRTVVLLATDGAPNCDSTISCGADECIPNIEGSCDANSNCCAPGGIAGPDGCVDEPATVVAIRSLRNAKIPTVVIGVPGSDIYATVLNDMAESGGATQPGGPPYYYPVDDLTMLTSVFQAIAQSFISCKVTLSPVPATMNETNVYFDSTIILEDPKNGWTWTSPDSIQLEGAACAQLKTGNVKQIEIISGCPTQKAM